MCGAMNCAILFITLPRYFMPVTLPPSFPISALRSLGDTKKEPSLDLNKTIESSQMSSHAIEDPHKKTYYPGHAMRGLVMGAYDSQRTKKGVIFEHPEEPGESGHGASNPFYTVTNFPRESVRKLISVRNPPERGTARAGWSMTTIYETLSNARNISRCDIAFALNLSVIRQPLPWAKSGSFGSLYPGQQFDIVGTELTGDSKQALPQEYSSLLTDEDTFKPQHLKPVSHKGSVIRFKTGTEEGDPYQVAPENAIFGSFAAFAPLDLKELNKVILVAHGISDPENESISVGDLPEEMAIRFIPPQGAALVGAFGRDLPSGQFYSGVKRGEDGLTYVQRSEKAKNDGKDSWTDLFCVPVGFIPNPKLRSLSMNEKAVIMTVNGDNSAKTMQPELSIMRDLGSIDVFCKTAQETEAVILTPRKRAGDFKTPCDQATYLNDAIVVSARLDKDNHGKIRELDVWSCTSPLNAPDQQYKADHREAFWKESKTENLSGEEANKKLFSGNDVLRRTPFFKPDATVNILSYPTSNGADIKEPPGRKRPPTYSTRRELNAPKDPVPEWEIVTLDGTFLPNTQKNRDKVSRDMAQLATGE
jgi:hypothetical protein